MSPERPNIRMSPRPITNGGVMIGSTDRMRKQLLVRKAGAGDDQREGEPERRAAAAQEARAAAYSTRRRSAFPPRCSRHPRPSPVNRRARNAESEKAPSLFSSAETESVHRKKNEHGHQGANRDDAAGNEGVALEIAAPGEPQREQHPERRDDQRRRRAPCRIGRHATRRTRCQRGNDQPAGPIANPCAKNTANPAAPNASTRLARIAGRMPGASVTAPASSNRPSGASQARPWRKRLHHRRRGFLWPQSRSHASAQTLSGSAYHGKRETRGPHRQPGQAARRVPTHRARR